MVSTFIDTRTDMGLFATAFGLTLIAYLFVSFVPGGARSKFFNKDFLKQFEEEHRGATGQDSVPGGGYPDMGNGRYAAKLSYKEWFLFGCAQRAHYNFLEQIPILLVFMAVSALQYPFVAGVLGLIALVGRIIVTFTYIQGPQHRWKGNVLLEPAYLGLVVLSFVSLFTRYSEVSAAN